jgi:polar amino acid transport system substrate-binding protein
MPAAAQEACSSYTVQRGDSLSGIAREAYGSISFQLIWDANRTAIGPNPNDISVGMSLDLPCEDGSLPSSTRASAVPAAPVSTGLDSVHLITGSDYPPYTDESLEGGGVFTQLMDAAMASVDTEYQITFVNDWGAHLPVLLPSGAFDGTFPWLRVDCEDPTLNEGMLERCENFFFADPVYEIVTGLFVRNGDSFETASDAASLMNKTICIPDGYGAVVAGSMGLTEDLVNYVKAETPEGCFDDLMATTVDIVEMELTQAEDIIKAAGIVDEVVVNPQMNSVLALTVYVHKENPNAELIIETLNQGIANIRADGTWFSTVRSGIAAYYEQ